MNRRAIVITERIRKYVDRGHEMNPNAMLFVPKKISPS
jgi:hypothetical protein